LTTYKKIYGLDGLRFFSFIFVILNHYFNIVQAYGFNIPEPAWIDSLGHLGLQYFFCGSGFLITYMLLLEQEKNGKLNVLYFYLRRIFRIWPAYLFLVLLLYIWIYNMPYFDIPGMSADFDRNKYTSLWLFILMVPHLAEYFNSSAPYLHHTYTIGIEEQFYIIWAFLMKYRIRSFKKVLTALLLIGLLLDITHYFFYADLQSLHLGFINSIATYYNYSQFTTFALGSLLAYYFKSNHSSLSFFKTKWLQIVYYCILGVVVYYNFYPNLLGKELLSFLMCFLLLFAAFKESSIFNYSFPLWEYLGKISYGVYLFHYIGLVLTVKPLIEHFHFNLYHTTDFLVSIVLCLVVTILLGIISYYTIEKFFFRLKDKFAVKR
jgi:peptidoglycan/LPS O-acetylase OafA/YrhL